MSETQDFLRRVEPFKRLTDAERVRLAVAARMKGYAKGETIFREGDPAEAVCVVKTGRVHLMKFSDAGQATTTCVMTAGEAFCCLPALDGKPYPVDAVAAEDSTVLRIPTRTFHEMLQRNPAVLQDALCLFCDRLRQVEHKSCAMHDPVERRLAQVLLDLTKKFGATIPLTKHELAEMAGTTVETAIRVMSHLRKSGTIKSVRGSTTVVKRAALERLAGP